MKYLKEFNPRRVGLYCFQSRSRNPKEKKTLLNGNGKTAIVGGRSPQTPGTAEPLTQSVEPHRTAQGFDLPAGREGKQNRLPFGCPAGHRNGNTLFATVCYSLRGACSWSPERGSARASVRGVSTAPQPNLRLGPQRKPRSGGHCCGGRVSILWQARLPKEPAVYLRTTVQVLEGKKPRPGRPPEARRHCNVCRPPGRTPEVSTAGWRRVCPKGAGCWQPHT